MDHNVVPMAFVGFFHVFVVVVVQLVWVVIALCGKENVVSEYNLDSIIDSKVVLSLVHTYGWIIILFLWRL